MAASSGVADVAAIPARWKKLGKHAVTEDEQFSTTGQEDRPISVPSLLDHTQAKYWCPFRGRRRRRELANGGFRP
jgi:hypothetical protein